jgi:serine phosphatase RsbU (regulator of sigma subunit)
MANAGERLTDPARLAALRATGLPDSPAEENFDRLAKLAARLLGAPIALVSLVDDQRQFFKSAIGLAEPFATERQTPLSHSFCQHVVTSGERLVIPDSLDDDRVRGNLAIPDLGVRAYAGVPLVGDGGHVLGSFCVIDTEPHKWSDDDVEILQELAASVMTEVELRRAADQARKAQQRLALLAEASRVLTSLDATQNLVHLARLAVRTLADWCSIAIVAEDGSTVHRTAIAHNDPVKELLAQQLRDQYPHNPDAPTGVPLVIRTGEPQLVAVVDDAALAATSHGDEYNQLLLTLGFASAMVVPLAARGRTLGAITFARGDGQPSYDEGDLRVASDLARRAALALDNARAYETQREIAATLQRSLLPPALPTTGPFEVAATYRTPGDTVLVGGDFYDLFPLRGAGWGVAIGDVQGKGSGAATLTALARYTVRAGALTLRNPKQVLRTLNEAILREGERFLTICLLTLQPTGDRLRARVCLAGHPLPMLVRATGEVEAVGRPGTLLGVVPDVDLFVFTFDVRPGDLIVLFTDGLTEARRDGELFGVEGVRKVLEGCGGQQPPEVVARLEQAVTEFVGGQPRDDMAILVLGSPAAA